MGLDSVELVMAVEEKFGITISDEEAQDVRTVGDMYQCVLRKVMVTDKSSCLTQKAFHLLRRTAKQLFNVPRDQFKPDAPLNMIIPRRSRRENWRKFQLAVGATNWPKLALSWLGALTLLAVVFAVPWSVFVCGTALLRWNVVVAGATAAVFLVLGIRAGKLITRPFETEFRGGISTVRDLAYVVVAQNPQLFGTERATWTADETWAVLASVIKTQTGVSQFTKDSRFVDDLRID
jgi:hypothetical protein